MERMKPVLIKQSEIDERIIIVSINRTEKLNSIHLELLESLQSELERINKVQHIKAVILTSESLKAFSTGIDVHFVKELANKEEVANFFYKLAHLFETVQQLRVPTIAAVNGYAFGAGADLALACDLRIANEVASFRFPGPQFGVVLGIQRLISEVGGSTARTLTLMNKLIDSKEALHDGVVHEVVSSANCLSRAEEWAKHLIEMPSFAKETIRNMCNRVERDLLMQDPCELAKKSILAVDFNEAFEQYVARIKK
ncbi:enoyl-CoA hydratase/isomerase family protein [Pseudogracilibacillus auburnensis]|nr:enoyl-CoA hydratase/isomerase family protein [Pseudogracilibacillus auburnensis]